VVKEIILYNLAANISDDEYKDYVTGEKGPLMDSLTSVEKLEEVKITGSVTGEIPYKYIGIMHLTSLEGYYQKDVPSQKFQAFLAKWKTMVSDFHVLSGEQIY